MINMIVAMDRETRGIGLDNTLPWEPIPEDMIHFRENTVGHTIVMGSQTFLSLGDMALPNRKNIVITRKRREYSDDVIQVYNPDQILKMRGEIWVIGGASIYSTFIDHADRILITELVTKNCKFDKYFPEITKGMWNIKVGNIHIAASGIKYRFIEYTKLKTDLTL